MRFHHASMTVSDLPAAMEFFRAAFGFAPDFVEEEMGADIARMAGHPGLLCAFTQMRAPGMDLVLELIAFTHPDGPPPADPLPWRPGAGHVCFHVDDLETTLTTCRTAGATVLGEVIAFPGGRCCYIRTPGDAFVELEWMAPAS
ncbi:VOC family protein [Pseudooceanicola marinus]|uniref:VOC family protein n=1 Tax=Pseudooceanicola marinus TaxID=396013 RepID=UPI001CD418E4|nr:VOC family protein [Pseudooceanicola marinus]MCA1335600.1 VOC family protein [Pseudooceanicola marinus]